MAASTVAGARIASLRGLLALCVGANVLEALLVVSVGPQGAGPLTVQAGAPVPFGVFHDLRWLAVYHRTALQFALEAVALLAVRGTLTGLSVGFAWPAGTPRPTWRRLLAQATAATIPLGLLLAPPAAMLFGLALVPVSWLFFVAVPTALLIALIAHPMAIDSRWWRRGVPPQAMGVVLATFLVVTLGSLAAAPAPGWAVPLVAAVTGVFEAWAWAALVRALVGRRRARVLPVVPVGLVLLAGLVVGGASVGFDRARAAEAASPRPAPAPPPPVPLHGQPVLVVSGYGSIWRGEPVHPVPGNFDEVQFSYRGLGADGQPLPYDGTDTVKPLTSLVTLMAVQVTALHDATGKDVDIVAESEGALVAKLYLEVTPGAPVHALVMASPLLAPGRVSYPPVGTTGWGVVTRDGLRSISDAFQPIAPIDLSPESPFLLSIDASAPLLRPLLSCPLSGVDQFALLPLADAVASPEPPDLPFPAAVVPAFHGGLLTRAPSEALVANVLRTGELPSPWWWNAADDAVRWSAATWQVPTLDVGSVERQRIGPLPTCASLAHDLEHAGAGP